MHYWDRNEGKSFGEICEKKEQGVFHFSQIYPVSFVDSLLSWGRGSLSRDGDQERKQSYLIEEDHPLGCK